MILNTPYIDLVPRPSDAEREKLHASFAEGQRDPVLVDEYANILDGHTRYAFFGDTTRVRTVEGLTDAEKKARVISERSARGVRQASNATAKAVAFELRAEDHKRWTQAAVAAALGVARQTVSDWFTDNAGSGNSRSPDARRGTKHAPEVVAEVVRRVGAGEVMSLVSRDTGIHYNTMRDWCVKAGVARPKPQKSEAPEPPPKTEARVSAKDRKRAQPYPLKSVIERAQTAELALEALDQYTAPNGVAGAPEEMAEALAIMKALLAFARRIEKRLHNEAEKVESDV